jgi:hypothetical protein
MCPLPTRSLLRGKQRYGVEISGGSRSLCDGRRGFGPISKLGQNVAESDTGSEEMMFSDPMKGKGKQRTHMLPPQVERPRGILRTTAQGNNSVMVMIFRLVQRGFWGFLYI